MPHGGTGFPVRLLIEEHLQPVAFPVRLDLTAIEGPALIFCFLFRGQLVNTGLGLPDRGVIVTQSIAFVRLGICPPAPGHLRFQLLNLLRGQKRATVQGLVLPVVGVDPFHGGLELFQPFHLFLTLPQNDVRRFNMVRHGIIRLAERERKAGAQEEKAA